MQWLYGAIKTTSQSILTQSNLTEHFLRESNQLLRIQAYLSHFDRMFSINWFDYVSETHLKEVFGCVDRPEFA